MREKRLFELIGMAADEYILEAELEFPQNTEKRRERAERFGTRRRYWYLWAAAAATVLLVAGALGLVVCLAG